MFKPKHVVMFMQK